MTLEEWQKHVRRTDVSNHEKKKIAYCGVEIEPFDWFFQDAEHAALTVLQDQRLAPCPKCAAVLKDVFSKGEQQ